MHVTPLPALPAAPAAAPSGEATPVGPFADLIASLIGAAVPPGGGAAATSPTALPPDADAQDASLATLLDDQAGDDEASPVATGEPDLLHDSMLAGILAPLSPTAPLLPPSPTPTEPPAHLGEPSLAATLLSAVLAPGTSVTPGTGDRPDDGTQPVTGHAVLPSAGTPVVASTAPAAGLAPELLWRAPIEPTIGTSAPTTAPPQPGGPIVADLKAAAPSAGPDAPAATAVVPSVPSEPATAPVPAAAPSLAFTLPADTAAADPVRPGPIPSSPPATESAAGTATTSTLQPHATTPPAGGAREIGDTHVDGTAPNEPRSALTLPHSALAVTSERDDSSTPSTAISEAVVAPAGDDVDAPAHQATRNIVSPVAADAAPESLAPDAVAPRPTHGTTAPTTGEARPNAEPTPLAQPSRLAEMTATMGRLVEEMRRGGDTQRRLVVRLDPPELGSVTIELTSIADDIAVSARTDTDDAMRALLRQRADIRMALDSLGMSLSGFDVRSENGSSEDRRRFGAPRSRQAPRGDLQPPFEERATPDSEGAIFL